MSKEKNTEKNIQIWRFIYIPLIIATLGLIPFVAGRIDKRNKKDITPKFVLVDNHTISIKKPYLLLKADNEEAKKTRNLDIKIGNFKLKDICKIVTPKANFRWRFEIKSIEQEILKTKLKTGENTIQVGFSDLGLWDTHSIFIHNITDFINADITTIRDSIIYKNSTKKNATRNNNNSVLEKDKASFVETKDSQFYEAIGYCVIDTAKYTIESQARVMAKKCAILEAKAELLKVIKGATIKGATTIRNSKDIEDDLVEKFEGTIRGVYQIVSTKIEAGMIQVKVRIDKERVSDIVDIY